MKVLHAALMSTPQRGVLTQMAWEAQAARELGIPWRSVVFGSAEVAELEPSLVFQAPRDPQFTVADRRTSAIGGWLSWRTDFYRWLKEQAEQVDVVLLRHTLHDPLRPWAVRHLRRPVYSVHHTLEVPELKISGRRQAARLEQMLGRESLRASTGIIAVTPEILEYEMGRLRPSRQGYVYPNGALVPTDPIDGIVPTTAAPEVLFLSDQFLPPHGLDRLLTSLAGSDCPIRLHLVGQVGAEDEKVAERDARVVMHGWRPEAEIRSLIEKCSVGLTSFALDRIDMAQACTLKVREYLRQGLPVYSGHREVLPDTFPYLETGGPEIDRIVDFAARVAGTKRQVIRDAAAWHIEKRHLLRELHQWLWDQHELRA